MRFLVPEIPKVGDYISVTKLDVREPLSEDYIVRKIWWRLRSNGDAESLGSVTEIFVECDISCGPYATRQWKSKVMHARQNGVDVEDFNVARVAVSLGGSRAEDET